MKLIKSFVIPFCLTLLSLPTQADIREAFICNFQDGKDMEDVMSARDFYIKQAKKAGVGTPTAFVWTPYKSSADIDLLWFNVHEDMMSFAKWSDAGMGSAEMQAVTDRFDTVADCNSALLNRELVFDGGEPAVPNPPAVITSYACNVRHGWSADDLDDLWDHVGGVLSNMDVYKPTLVFASTPITSGPNTPDVFLYSVHDSTTAMVTKTAARLGSEAGAQLGRHFQKVLDCNQSFWIGQRVIE